MYFIYYLLGNICLHIKNNKFFIFIFIFLFREIFLFFFYLNTLIMFNIKSFLFSWYLFVLSRFFIMILSPQFIVLLTWIIFMSYRIYFEPVILCEPNWTLVELKLNLTHKLADLRLAEVELAKYQDIDEQYRAVLTEAEAPTRPSSIDIVRKNGYDLRHTIEKKKALLIKVTELETSIKKLDPHYKSVIVATKYPHVGRSNWI